MRIRILITVLLGILAMTGQAQKHLPRFKYSKEPAVLSGGVVGDSTLRPKDAKVIHWMKYNAGMGDARKDTKEVFDKNGCCSFSLHTGTTANCLVRIGDYEFTCYVVPGDTVSFTLDLDGVKTQGLSQSLSFTGTLSDFNKDLVYAMEKGIDPETLYQEIESKRNMSQLINDLPEVSIYGFMNMLL